MIATSSSIDVGKLVKSSEILPIRTCLYNSSLSLSPCMTFCAMNENIE